MHGKESMYYSISFQHVFVSQLSRQIYVSPLPASNVKHALFFKLLLINTMKLFNTPLYVHTHVIQQWQSTDVLCPSGANCNIVVCRGYCEACVFDHVLLCYDQQLKTTSDQIKYDLKLTFKATWERPFSEKWKYEHLQFHDKQGNAIWSGKFL